MSRPLIAIPGRFTESTSALRRRGVVNARALLQAVYAAGGEPLTVFPDADPTPERLDWCDGLLLPGGGDLAPRFYGQDWASEHLYDIDETQDEFDLAAVRWAEAAGTPMLSICRGTQVVNTVHGGDLEQHMAEGHQYLTHEVAVRSPALAAILGGERAQVFCHHHQRIRRLGDGLACAATCRDGTVEAMVAADTTRWYLGLQWHPEDTAATDRRQAGLFEVFVAAAREWRDAKRAPRSDHGVATGGEERRDG